MINGVHHLCNIVQAVPSPKLPEWTPQTRSTVKPRRRRYDLAARRRLRDDARQRHPSLEARIHDKLGVTVCCISLTPGELGICPSAVSRAPKCVVWAKTY
jgi:hypothetical protein